jgi:hypothetical protein
MPYRVGGKGTSGCSGFPVVDEKGKVVGCHPTKSKAVNHLQALYVNVPDAKKDYSVDANVISESPVSENPSNNINRAVGMRKPNYLTASRKAKKKKTNKAEMADLYVMLSEEEKAFTDALNGIANKFGKLKEDGGIWIGYVPAVANEDAYMGVMCKNCVFFQGNNICGIVEQKVEDAGICRLAAIPDELITPEESDGTYDGCGCMTCMSLNCECEYCPVCNEDNQMSEQDMQDEQNMEEETMQDEVTNKSFWGVFDPKPVVSHIVKDDSNAWIDSPFAKRDYSPSARRRMASEGQAMPDGSFPIANRADLMNAIRSWGRGGSDPKVKEHIKRRARALGAEDMIPDNWK